MRVGICAIIKDCKQTYLNEWLNWHRLIGVDCFFIYDNDSTIPIQKTILNMDGVTVIPFPGKIQQLVVYNDCLEKQKKVKDCDWIALIDDDEFIVIEKGNIKTFLSEQKHSGVCLNWILFGASEETGTENLTQIQKYKKHIPLTNSVNTHVKSIVKVEAVKKIQHPHFAIYKDGIAVDVFGNEVNSPFVKKAVQEIAWINHYHCRSRNEYMERVARGRCDSHLNYKMESFEIMNNQATECSTKIQEIYKTLTK